MVPACGPFTGVAGKWALGSVSEVSLKEAREAAEKWRAKVRDNIDPIKERERLRKEAEREQYTLRQIAEEAFEARKAELKDDGKAGRWFSPLELHVLPKLGKVPVEDIDQKDIRDTLAPLWHTKADTARKAMNRLGIALKYAAALGLDVDLQATEKAKALLGKTRHEVKHIESVHWSNVPDFYGSLSDGSVTHLALRLLILTGMRSKAIRFCQLDQIDGDLWTVPAEFMKARKGKATEFRVPLSDEAQSVIEQAKAHERGGYLFPSIRKGVISDATMSRLMERRGMSERPHGFRTSLREWVSEVYGAPWEVAETCIAHSVGNKVQQAYLRTDFYEQRVPIMQRWGEHMTGGLGKLVRMVGNG